MAERQIVAMGGGGSDEDEAARLITFLLGLTGKERPRVGFVPTASAENPELLVSLYAAFSGRADCSHIPFFPWPPEDLRERALSQDVLFVGGGNTANMLAVWRVHGFDAILREAWEQGTVLSGGSAGMICWFEAGVTDSFGPQLEGMRDGLGFLPGSAARTTTARSAGAPSTRSWSQTASLPESPRTMRSRCTTSEPSCVRS